MDTINTIGRRKNAVARVYLKEGSGKIVVNKREFGDYFPVIKLRNIVSDPFEVTETKDKFDIIVNLRGGGPTGQANALQLAIARALVKADPEHRKPLKVKGYLMRDPRMVERKKYGQKKARKKFQFSKR